MQKIIVKLSIILAVMAEIIFAQNSGSMQTITVPDGLSNTDVKSVYQDRFGYIWIMTADGLNRYDGNKIRIYRNDPDDSTTISNNSTWSATEDKEGYLWIGGQNEANRYDYSSDSFQQFRFTSTSASGNGQMIISMFTDSEGRIWAGTMGGTIHLYNVKNRTFDAVYHEVHAEQKYVGEVWSIIQLKNGKILFSNQRTGIFQYDESSGKLNDFFLGKDFSPKLIIRIQEDDDGTIWFSGEDRVIRYNPNFYSYEILEGFQILPKIYYDGYHKIDAENYVFFAEPYGLLFYNPQKRQVTKTIPTELAPYWAITDKYGIVWIACHGGVIKYDPQNMPFQHLKLSSGIVQDSRSNNLMNIQFDDVKRESIWALSDNNSLLRYNLKNGETKTISFGLPDEFKILSFDNFTKDRNDNFYFSVNNHSGILKYSIDDKKASVMENLSFALDPRITVSDLTIDPNNNLIVATNGGVILSDLSLNNQEIVTNVANRQYPQSLKSKIQNVLKNANPIALITKANETQKYSIDFKVQKETKVLIHCMGEGVLDRFEKSMFDFGTLSSESGKVVFSMNNLSNNFHAGGSLKNRKEYAVLTLQPGNYNLTYTMDAGHSYPNFNALMPTDSALYGIQVYEIPDAAYETLEKELSKLNNENVLLMQAASDVELSRKYSHSIYISSPSRGLFRYNISNKTFTQYTFGEIKNENKKNIVNSCYEDITGNVWVSTEQGLIMLNPDNGKWRVFTEKDGLPSNNILRSIEDKNGNLWIISLGGLSRFNKNDPSENWNFVNYDTRDGLAGYSFNGNMLQTPEGEIMFIVGDIIHSFTPGKSNPVRPDVVINDFKISDVSVFDQESPFRLQKSLMETKEIDLSYTLNDLSFNFSVIHYARPYKNKLFYKLEGFNKDWIESELGTATYTNLEPGTYEFKIRGVSADGLNNSKDASIIIRIAPPWWRTTSAYFGYVVFLGLIIFGVDRIQRRRVLTKERAATAIREAELRAQLAEAENERKSKELEEARQLQLSMLPKELPKLPHLDIAVYMQTATEVGGDYYDFHVALDGTLTVVIGDATGHGLRAGTMVTTVKSLFKSHAPNPDILFSFQEITRCIKQMNFDKLSMCMTMLKIQSDKLTMSVAGMPPAFIFRKDTRVVEEHLFQAMPLGTMEKFPYEIKDTILKPGDTILLLSDGLPELKNSVGEMYGYKNIRNNFEDVAEQAPEEIISFFKNEGSGWINNADPDDDVTFVVIKVK
ncbi:MAG: SpoIIE family protein phosphatase [Calditrichaeota bacterium]|nr:SpoIIE family protein phosphatase [Calditrichota bacterium]